MKDKIEGTIRINISKDTTLAAISIKGRVFAIYPVCPDHCDKHKFKKFGFEKASGGWHLHLKYIGVSYSRCLIKRKMRP